MRIGLWYFFQSREATTMLCNSHTQPAPSYIEVPIYPLFNSSIRKKWSHLLHPSKVRPVLSAICFQDLLLCNASILIFQSVHGRCVLPPLSTPTGSTLSLFCSTYESSAHPNFNIWLFFILAAYVVLPFLLSLSWCLFFYDVLFPGFSWYCFHLCSSWQELKLTVPSDIVSEWQKIQQKNKE